MVFANGDKRPYFGESKIGRPEIHVSKCLVKKEDGGVYGKKSERKRAYGI